MNLQSVVATILIRDQYRYVRLYYVTRMVALTCGLILVSVLGNIHLANQPVQYRYIMTKPTGEILPLVPLDQANMDDEALLAWTVDAVTRLHTFDFANYRRQFQQAQELLTVSGWVWFEDAMRSSGNFNSIIRNRYVTTAVPTGPARIVGRQYVEAGDGRRYSWVVEFPMLITYRSGEKTTTQDLDMRVVVARVPEFVAKSGLQLRQILAR